MSRYGGIAPFFFDTIFNVYSKSRWYYFIKHDLSLNQFFIFIFSLTDFIKVLIIEILITRLNNFQVSLIRI